MAKFAVYATEFVTYENIIEASSKEEAMELAKDQGHWDIIDGDNFKIYAADELKEQP